MCCRPGAVPAQLAALRVRDPARRDIGGWGRGRRGGAKSALVMIQLAWPRSLQPLPGIVAGLFGSCRALLPGDWGVCSIRSCFTACRRRVVALLVQFPPWATVWGHGWRPGPPTHAPQSPPGPPRPRLAHPCPQAPPGPQAPARPTHAPRPRQAHPRPQAPPGPLMPPGPARPTHAPRPRLAPRQPVPRSFPRHFRHLSEMAPNPYI